MSALGVVVGGASAAAASAAAPDGLEALRWKKRIVLVFAACADDPRLVRQRKVVEVLVRRADDRDLQLVSVVGAEVSPPLGEAGALRRRFQVEDARFEALLIGKDGGVKLRSAQGFSADQLASTIDAMPMRRSEAHGG